MGDDRQLPPQPARLTAASYTGLFPGGSMGKESTCSTGDIGNMGLIPGLGRSPGVGKGNPFQYSCLEDCMNRGAWQAIVHGVAKSWT